MGFLIMRRPLHLWYESFMFAILWSLFVFIDVLLIKWMQIPLFLRGIYLKWCIWSLLLKFLIPLNMHVASLHYIYGLKQAWFEKFMGFTASHYDSGLFTKSTALCTILLLYVDDMIIYRKWSTWYMTWKSLCISTLRWKI